MKMLIAILAAGYALVITAETGKSTKTVEQIYNERYGGLLPAPGSYKGIIGFVDRASGVAKSDIEKVIKTVRKEMKYNFRIVQAQPKAGLPTWSDVKDAGLNVAVFIVSDKDFPPLLFAPEERWAMVNLAKLNEGLPGNELGKRLLSARHRGEIMRAFALACGSGASQYPGNILDVTSVQELDSVDPDSLIFDMVQRAKPYLASIGVTPVKKVPYNVACKQGWAPAPTNDVQKAVWDQVHAIPTKPVKITYDKAAQKPVVK